MNILDKKKTRSCLNRCQFEAATTRLNKIFFKFFFFFFFEVASGCVIAIIGHEGVHDVVRVSTLLPGRLPAGLIDGWPGSREVFFFPNRRVKVHFFFLPP